MANSNSNSITLTFTLHNSTHLASTSNSGVPSPSVRNCGTFTANPRGKVLNNISSLHGRAP